MKKITALILAIILCFTLAIPALGSEMSVNGQAYSINGIDVYKYPLKASQYFSVETIIYFVSDAAFAQVPVNDDVGVYLVTTMEEVTSISMMRLLFSTTLNSFLKLKMQIFLPLIWFRKHFRLNSRMRLQHLMIGIRPQTIV